MQHKQIERKALGVGIIINILMVVAGAIVFFMTGLKAMFLDYHLHCDLRGLGPGGHLSLLAHRAHHRTVPPTACSRWSRFNAICKAIFTLSLLVFSFLDVAQVAWDYFVLGVGGARVLRPRGDLPDPDRGHLFRPAYVLPAARTPRIGDSSMMLRAEAQSTLVDGMISFGIGLAAVVLVLLPAGGPLDFPALHRRLLHHHGDRDPGRQGTGRGAARRVRWNSSAACMTTTRPIPSWNRPRNGICRPTPNTRRR